MIMTANIMTSVVLALLATFSSAAPLAARQTDPSVTITDQMQIALGSWLASHSVTTFHPIADGWSAIDFAGGSSSLNMEESNNAVMRTCDMVHNATDPNGPGVVFSSIYMDFVQEVIVAAGLNFTSISQDPGYQKAIAATVSAKAGLASALASTMKEYNAAGLGPINNVSDPNLLVYAAQDPEYQAAKSAYTMATNSFHAYSTTLEGDDGWAFAAADANIQNVLTQTTTAVEGQTMKLAGDEIVPSYSIPTLNSTLLSWQQGYSSPFEYSTGKTSGDQSNSTSSSSSDVSFLWEKLGSTSSSTSDSSSNTTAQSFSMSFGGIALLGIELGDWFDSWRVASAVHTPADDISKKGSAVFDRFFGTEENPGPASQYKDQALVIYQPAFQVTFQSAAQASQFAQDSSSVGGCFLFICPFKTSSSSSSNNVHYETNSMVVSYNDTSTNAYIVGFTYASFWSGGQVSG